MAASAFTPRTATAATSLLLTGGCINGWMFRIIEAWKADGVAATAGLFAISPFELIVMAVALRLLWNAQSNPDATSLTMPALAFAGLVLWPSSLAAWVAIVLFGFWLALKYKGSVRAAALLFAGLGACALWSTMVEPLVSNVLLPLDASAAASLLGWVRADVIRTGNIVSVDGHSIVVLAGCSSFHALPLALLSWLALRLAWDRPVDARSGWIAVSLALALVAGNVVRLAVMGWSPSAYAAAHGAMGGMLFDGLTTVAVLAAAILPVPRHD
ncbi:MAG: hypothetical protein KIS73_01195 [Enhydrobacter sp.]|nr:hypothetical protein [Enhydrobacter sp.]